jgi:hypothetical protein
MKTLITIAMVLIFSTVALILSTLETLIGYLLINVNWPLCFVISFSVLIIYTLTRTPNFRNNGKSI